jgi:hypothetical protein
MVTRHTLRTAARERMLAIDAGLNQTDPKLGMSPSMVETWVPPLVSTVNCLVLGRMFFNRWGLLKTETVDSLSRRTHVLGMASMLRSRWANEKPS